MANFKYLICLDFEATCWAERNLDNAEIIEYGAVLLNLENGTILSKFHDYVRPTKHPILSEYCINLTKITQEFINRKETFPIVHKRFIKWIEDISAANHLKLTDPNARNATFPYSRNATFCSWTNWDLDHYYRLDCERNGIFRPGFLRAWIDARKIFAKAHPGRIDFKSALELLTIEQDVNEHSAIADANDLSKMMLSMYKNGAHLFQVTDWRFYQK